MKPSLNMERPATSVLQNNGRTWWSNRRRRLMQHAIDAERLDQAWPQQVKPDKQS